MHEQRIPLRHDADVVAAWKAALGLSRKIGFSAFKQSCLSGAVLELCRAAAERGGGSCELSDRSDAASLRAAVVVDGCPPELAGGGRGRLGREIHVGPSLPAVRLHQVADALSADPSPAGCRVMLTISEARTAPKPRPYAGTACTTR